MKVEFWSDIVCPWCGIGKRRLERALEGFAHRDQVHVVFRSFQLDPGLEPGKTEPVRRHLFKKYHLSGSALDANLRRIVTLALAEGFPAYLVGEQLTGSTRWAHEMLAFAQSQGVEAPAWEALYQAYFVQGRSIFTQEALQEIAAELGLEASALQRVWDEGSAFARVVADQEAARKLGVQGVPFALFDGKYGVSGAQPVEVFTAALERAWAEQPPEALDGEAFGAQGVCTPEGCDLP